MTNPTAEPAKKLFLLDAYALIYRAYFAFIKNPRFNSKGLNTSAILGFTNTLDQVLKEQDPTHIAVAFDMKGPTFRHEMYEPYKANREEMPEDLRKSIPHIRKLIEAYRIPIIEAAGYEADDVIGAMAKRAEKDGFTVYMMTPDKDYAQLVSDNIFMYKPKRGGGEAEIWGKSDVYENFAITRPEQVIDILGLMGDTADNIPGCPGVGPKTAMKLIGQFDSIDGIYQNIDQLKGKQKEKLVDNEEQVRLSKKLAEIVLDVPLAITPDELKRNELNKDQLRILFSEFEFRAQLNRLGVSTPKEPEPMIAFGQGTLFGGPEIAEEVVAKSEQNNIETVEHRYYLMDTPELRADLRADLSVQDQFCFDTETTGLDVHSAELVCLSFSFTNNEAYCVPLPVDFEEAKSIVLEFKSIFEDSRILKVAQNIKFDMLMLKHYGVDVTGPLFDTMIAHYILQPEQKHNLDYLCEVYLNYEKVTTESLIGKKGRKQLTMRQISVDKLCEYACEDADLTLQLKKTLEIELEKEKLVSLFQDVEMPLVNVLTEMEFSGVTLKREVLDVFAEKLRKQLLELEQRIISHAGEEFNVSSPKQLGVILFEKLQLDSKAKKTKTKQYSTGEEVLLKLKDKHPIIEDVLEFRSLKKLLSTYVEALPELISKRSGKIHTSFNQARTATGRLSSDNPNLQNIPIRDENGREIRKAFIASGADHTFLSADYSQIELRLMASMSEDEHMIAAFNRGEDIHAATAARIYDVSIDDVTDEMRRNAKTANFGIIYGISAFGLSQRLGISRSDAKKLIDDYFLSFPKVKSFMDSAIVDARENGFVQTILGRRRYLNDINSANAVVRGVAERNAINAPIQGSAADIIKLAMIKIQTEFDKRGLKSKMILQVHDELNFDVLVSELEEVKVIVKKEMEGAFKFNVPLTIEMKAAENWLEAH